MGVVMKTGTHLLVSFVIGVASSLTANNITGANMDWIFEHLIKGVWPWYVGLVVFGIYWLVKYLYDRKKKMDRLIEYLTSPVLTQYFLDGNQPSLEQKINVMITKALDQRLKTK